MDATQAKADLERMRRSLVDWLKYRKLNDEIASGKRPGKVPADQFRAELAEKRFDAEQPLADNLHQLLSEVMDPQQLPSPDVSRDPNAAAKLAAIAVLGRAEGEAPLPTPQGGFGIGTIWPLAAIAGVLIVIMHAISSAADVAKEKERLECVKAGACTDSGFWVKAAAVLGIGYVGWRVYGHHLTPKKGR